VITIKSHKHNNNTYYYVWEYKGEGIEAKKLKF